MYAHGVALRSSDRSPTLALFFGLLVTMAAVVAYS